MKVTTTRNGTAQFLLIETAEADASYLMESGETEAMALQRLIDEYELRAARLKATADRLRVARLFVEREGA